MMKNVSRRIQGHDRSGRRRQPADVRALQRQREGHVHEVDAFTWLPRKYGYVRKTVPGLDSLYIASMWTVPPGGLPSAAMAGREVAQMVCAGDGRRFATTKLDV